MNLHVVKVKCPIKEVKPNGEEYVKTISAAVAIYNAGTFGNAEVETAKYFEKKVTPENSHTVTGISKMNIHSVMYQVTPESADELDNDPVWVKVKVELRGDEKPFSNVYLVLAENVEKAQEHVKHSWNKTTFEVIIKTSSVIALMEYIELDSPEDEEKAITEALNEKKDVSYTEEDNSF